MLLSHLSLPPFLYGMSDLCLNEDNEQKYAPNYAQALTPADV